jgi:hypothetical protein
MDMTSFDGPNGRHFQVTVISFKQGLNSAVGAKEGGLSGMINSFVEDGGKLVKREEITRGTCSGIEAILQVPHFTTRVPSLVKARTFSSGDRVYLILYGGAADTAQEKTVADHFLDSFAVTGGCVDSAAAYGVRPSTTTVVSGNPETPNGWQRFTVQGITFLLPGTAELVTERIAGPKGPIPHYTYGHGGLGHVFSVEIFDGFDPEFRNSPGLLEASIDGTVAATRKTMETAGVRLSDGKPVRLGSMTGREFQLVVEDGSSRGRLQIFATKSRTYALTAFQLEDKADPALISRFFAAVAVQP